MAAYTDSLRGYSYAIHMRDGFRCVYCGMDGHESLSHWLTLSSDHLLPTGHPQRENPKFIATACQFCNTAANRYFDMAMREGLTFDGKSRVELIAQRRPYVMKTRQDYKQFWQEKVASQMRQG